MALRQLGLMYMDGALALLQEGEVHNGTSWCWQHMHKLWHPPQPTSEASAGALESGDTTQPALEPHHFLPLLELGIKRLRWLLNHTHTHVIPASHLQERIWLHNP